MKIKGIHRDGKNSGEIIELSAEEKVPLTLQDGISKYEEFEGKFLAWTSSPSLSNVRFYPKGELLKGRWQHNHYIATGSVVLHMRKLDPDRLLAPKKRTFLLEFEDCLDPIGQPDTKVTKLVLGG